MKNSCVLSVILSCCLFLFVCVDSTPAPPPPPAIQAKISSVVEKLKLSVTPTTPHTPTAKLVVAKTGNLSHQKYHDKNNLRLVFQTVLPAGKEKPNHNVVFEYFNEEENKTCRCICRNKML